MDGQSQPTPRKTLVLLSMLLWAVTAAAAQALVLYVQALEDAAAKTGGPGDAQFAVGLAAVMLGLSLVAACLVTWRLVRRGRT